MTEKELLQKLSGLKSIKPGGKWRKSSREILFTQISGGKEAEAANWFEVFENLMPEPVLVFFSKPAAVVVAIALIVLGGGALSLKASSGTKPGDSLYIAKIVSEKTQQALTFGDKEKVRLNLEFAGKRAEEAAKVLSEAAPEPDKTAKIEALSSNFKKEIGAAKTRLSKIAPTAPAAGTASPIPEEDSQVFGANLGKSNERLEISDSGEAGKIAAGEATSTAAAEAPQAANGNTADNMLTEAEKLFDLKDYQGSLDKIKAATEMIEKGEATEKPAAENPVAPTQASSTTETKPENATSTTK